MYDRVGFSDGFVVQATPDLSLAFPESSRVGALAFGLVLPARGSVSTTWNAGCLYDG
jgi:hypothetical protein